MMVRPLLPFALVVLLAAAIAPETARAQPFPSRPVKIVVPTSPGGATDAFARALAARLSESWGQAVLVENRPGANQILGADHVSKSAPDGNTLLVSDASSFVTRVCKELLCGGVGRSRCWCAFPG
jgi:tripartite-type tricarboxylate transporter receptor subunit TctC